MKKSFIKKMIRTGCVGAAVMLTVLSSACGKGDSASSAEAVSPAGSETISGSDESGTGSREVIQATETPTPTPTPTPSPTPTPDPVYVRPSYANVVSGSNSYVDERGSFISMENSLIVFLPTDDAEGYVWHCLENGGDGVFEIADEEVRRVPYTYTSGKYGGKKTLKSAVKTSESNADESSVNESGVTDSNISEVPSEDMIEENGTAEYDDIYADEVPEEYVEEYVEEIPEEYVEEEPIYEDIYVEEDPGVIDEYVEEEYVVGDDGVMPVSLNIGTSAVCRKSGHGITFMSSQQNSAVTGEDYTYVYAPSRSEYTFTAHSPGTGVYCLEYTRDTTAVPELDSGYILYLYADENLNVTFDLVHYSFAECVTAPDGVPEAEATVTKEQAAELADRAAETYDSCLRDNNMIGAAAEMVEGAYWEAVVMDPGVAQLTGNGSAFYHEDYQDYSWDVFTINPVSPGRTTAYFVYRNGDYSVIPRMQVVNIVIGDDLSVTAHVRRYDLGVVFD